MINGEPNLSQTSNNSSESNESDKVSVIGLKQVNVATKTVPFQKGPSKSENVAEIVEIQVEAPKKVETKELITPAFNQGIHTVAPTNFKMLPSTLRIPKLSAEQEKTAEKVTKSVEKNQALSIEAMRRNQNAFANQQPKVQTPKEPRIFLNDLKVRPLPIEKTRVKIVGECECPKAFYVIESLIVVDSYLAHLEESINEIVKNAKIKSYKPLMNEIVLAQFEGAYYRAAVEDIINDDPSKPIYGVSFIDYGNVSQVYEDDLLACTSKAKGEIILHAVLFENLPSTLTKDLEEMLKSQDGFDIVVKEKTDKYYIAMIDGI